MSKLISKDLDNIGYRCICVLFYSYFFFGANVLNGHIKCNEEDAHKYHRKDILCHSLDYMFYICILYNILYFTRIYILFSNEAVSLSTAKANWLSDGFHDIKPFGSLIFFCFRLPHKFKWVFCLIVRFFWNLFLTSISVCYRRFGLCCFFFDAVIIVVVVLSWKISTLPVTSSLSRSFCLFVYKYFFSLYFLK